jgi:uncharacterized protein involved in exopolysaccharide biosynthesis
MPIGLPHVRTLRFPLAAILLCAACSSIPGLSGLHGQEKEPSAVVEAAILVVPKAPDKSADGNGLRTQLLLLRSPTVLERAVKKRDLASLKSFAKAADPVSVISAGLTVTRDPGSDGAVIALTYRGPSADDGVKVLSAILESYQEFLEVTYRNVSDETLEAMAKARDIIGKDLSSAEEKYLKYRQDAGLTPEIDKGISAERIHALERKKTELLIRQTDLRTELKQTEGAAAGAGLQIEIHEWATRTSFDKLPKAIQEKGEITGYKEHLKEKLDRLVATEKALDQLIRDEKKKYREMARSELEEERFRKGVERHQQLYDATIQRIKEVDLMRDSTGFATRVISPPKVRIPR